MAQKRKTILNLNEKIRRSMGQTISKKDRIRLAKLKKKRDGQIKVNKQASKDKREIRKEGEKKGWSEKKIKSEQAKVFSYPLRDLDNQANRLLKKSFIYTVTDRFNAPYKLKTSDILKKDVTESILKKMAVGIQRAIDKTPKNNKKVRDVLTKLHDKVLYNLQVYQSGAKTFNQKQLDEQDIKYPLFAEIIDEAIIII